MDETYVPVKGVDKLFHDSGQCNLIVLHSMECPMVDGRAVSWANYLHVTDWPFFAQEYYDPANAVRVAPLDTKVAHCGNGNSYGGHRSIGREHAGYAGQPRSLWESPAGRSMLGASAIATRKDCDKWSIPPVFLSPDDLRAGKRGITSHNNCSIALHGSTHTDPGDNFPYDLYLQMVTKAATPVAPAPPQETDEMIILASTGPHPPVNAVANAYYACSSGSFDRTLLSPSALASWHNLIALDATTGKDIGPNDIYVGLHPHDIGNTKLPGDT